MVPHKPSLSMLPPQIHLKIFDILDAVRSTCLGLTCKKFYSIHRGVWGTVPLNAWKWYTEDNSAHTLRDLLEGFRPVGLLYCPVRVRKWLTKERYEEVMEGVYPTSKRQPLEPGPFPQTWDLFRPWVQFNKEGNEIREIKQSGKLGEEGIIHESAALRWSKFRGPEYHAKWGGWIAK
jgi:hypothetical protein